MNNLATIEPPQVPMADMVRMAEAFYKCGLFGYKTPEQALALMLIAQAEGLHPAQAAREYNIIQNRPALTAEAMLSRFQRAGGKVNWLTYNATEVTGEFSHPSGGTLAVTWTLERARRAGLLGKDNWNKYPEAMLASRCISEGVRRVCPGAVLGVYTPEETEDFIPRSAIAVESANMGLDGSRGDDEYVVQARLEDDAEIESPAERAARGKQYREAAKTAPPREREPASAVVMGVAAERAATAKAAAADASGDTRKDVKLTMTGGGTTYTGDGGEKPCVVFKALHGSKEFTLRHYNPITFGERVAAAGDPENKLTPHKHEGPIIADLTAAPDGNGGYIYTCSNLRIVPAVAEVPAPELGEPISEDELAAMTAKGKK